MVPPEVEVDNDDDAGNLIGNPNVNVILPPIEGDPNFPLLGNPNFDPNPYDTDEESVEDLGYNDDDIDFNIIADENTTTSSLLYTDRRNELLRQNARRRALETLAKKRQRKAAAAEAARNTKKPQMIPEFDNDKIIIDDEGEVTITEPENAQIDYNSVMPYYNEVIQLPGNNDSHMADVRTKNLVLKRKRPQDESVAVKKYIAGSDINARSVWDVALPIPKDEVVEIDEGDGEEEDIKPNINGDSLATVDINTMCKMPWVDFSIVLRENDAERREQAIMKLLQNNMPDNNDQCYIYHDQETNTFSAELDENAEEVQDIIEDIRVIDAKLNVEYLSVKERKRLKNEKKRLLKFLNDYYGIKTLSRVMANKRDPKEQKELENGVIEIENELNSAGDNWYHNYNKDIEESEINKESHQAADISHRITAAILRTDEQLAAETSAQKIRGLKKVKKYLLLYLKLVGMDELAESLDD